mgnify:CR=1 FL=1
MHVIEMQEMTEAFFPCWEAAAEHLDRQVEGGIRSWLRAHPYPPVLEHLSFRLGNQLFFIRVEDVDAKVPGPGSRRGLSTIASGANGHACILPMKRRFFGGAWVPDQPSWGLLDAASGRAIDPAALVTDRNIEMSDWELQDMAVQVVRGHLEQQGFELMSWQGNPQVDPSIWFVGASGRPEWMVVRATRFPVMQADRPANWTAIAEGCARLSRTGHFASVAMVSTSQPFAANHEQPIPLWRGHGMHVRFEGLV